MVSYHLKFSQKELVVVISINFNVNSSYIACVVNLIAYILIGCTVQAVKVEAFRNHSCQRTWGGTDASPCYRSTHITHILYKHIYKYIMKGENYLTLEGNMRFSATPGGMAPVEFFGPSDLK